jgi:alpha-amylase
MFHRIAILSCLLVWVSLWSQAHAEAPWHTQTVIYQVFVEKFSTQKSLKGVKDNLNYLQDLGVKTIWLMPVFEAMSDHGYDTTNYYKIAARYGTEQDLKDLSQAAHERGMRIVLDLVINHTGTMHPWFSSTNGTERKDKWYIWANRDLGWDDPWKYNPATNTPKRTWFKDPFADFDRNGDGNAHNDDFYYSVFGDGDQEIRDGAGTVVGIGGTMPDLNYNDAAAKDEIVAEIKKVMEHWLTNTKVDGFRCDAVRYLSEFGAGNQAEQGRTHEVWKNFRAWLDLKHPEAILLAEAPTETYAQMRTYYGSGDEFHSAFHFKLPYLLISAPRTGSRPNNFFGELYEIQSHLPAKAQDVLFLSNHDQFAGDRVASQLGGDIAKVKSAGSLYLLLSGNPSIYYAEELAALGVGSDSAIREPLDWSTIRTQSFDEDSVLNHYKRLLALRNQYAALRGGATYFAHSHYSSDNRWDNNQSDTAKITTIVRELAGEKILVVHNFGDENERIHVSLDSTSLSIPNGAAAYSLMGSVPVEAVSAVNRNFYDLGTVPPKCSAAVYFGDIAPYKLPSGFFTTYENALQNGDQTVTVHFREARPAAKYFIHAWDENGLACNNKVAMNYEGKFNGAHWWSLTLNKMPRNFEFCFVDSDNNWDGVNRTFTQQGADVFVVAGSTTVSTTRP